MGLRGSRSVHQSLQALDLVVDPIRDAALQNCRNVLIELAVLPPQGRYRDNDRRLHLPKVQNDLAERAKDGLCIGDRLDWHHALLLCRVIRIRYFSTRHIY